MVSVVSLARSTCRMMDTIVRYRKILAAVTNIEIAKRYSGFAFGKIWVVLYPALLLGNYLFVYLVIFRMRFPDYSQFDYVLYVFCGLIPFLAISETLATGCLVLKQNLHLVKNVMLPIELIPVRSVLVSMVAQLASMGILLIMLGFHGNLTFHVLWLPFILVLQFFMLLGMLLILSLLALLIPDVSYFVNLLLLFLMFVSPIGFKPEMVPEKLRFVVYLNPIHYLTDMYRCCLLWGKVPPIEEIGLCVLVCVGIFAVGSTFFQKLKDVLVDYE